MTRRKAFWVVALLMLAALVLAACGSPAPADVAPEAEGAVDEPAAAGEGEEEPAAEAEDTGERKVATFIFTQEFDSLNPYYTNMWFVAITQPLWLNWAWQYDENNEAYPVLVTEMPSIENGGISEDGLTITLTLRDDLVWSDGTPLTSADFVFTHEMIMNPANTVATTFPNDQLASLEAPDERTVVMNFAEPFVAWEASFWHGLLPKHILEPVFEAEGSLDSAEWNLNPMVGAGPFVLDTWESGSFARFVRNENYWGEPAILDEIFVRFVPDDAAQINALVAGDGHLGTFFAYSDIPTLEEAGIEVIPVQSGYNEGWYMLIDEEIGHPALLDQSVRQAIAMGFDRAAISNDLLMGLTQPAATYWDNTPYAAPELEPWPYDPERAAELLDEAGWVDSNGDGTRDKDGVELVLLYGTTTREIRQDTQAVAQQQLAEIGVGVELVNVDSDLFFATDGPAASGELDIMQWSDTTEFPDPSISYWRISEIPTDENPIGLNWQRIRDEELDALFLEADSTPDPDARQELYHEISRQMFDKVYWLGIWQDPDLFGVSEDLTNVRLSGANPFFSIAEWDLAR